MRQAGRQQAPYFPFLNLLHFHVYTYFHVTLAVAHLINIRNRGTQLNVHNFSTSVKKANYIAI
jgi:hypothetical protein